MVSPPSRKIGLAGLITAIIFASESSLSVNSFAPPPAITRAHVSYDTSKGEIPIESVSSHSSALFHARGDDATSSDEESSKMSSLRQNKIHRIKSILKPVSLAIFTAGLVSRQGAVLDSNPFVPLPSHASAPLVPYKNFVPPDVKGDAIKKANEAVANRKELDAAIHKMECDKIEAEQGKAAREAYEAEYNAASKKRAEEKAIRGKKMYYDLADQGICPYTDVEGKRQICLIEEGIDLNKVTATDQQQELVEMTRPKHVARRVKQRFIVKCIVEDLKMKGEDPVAYLESNKYKTSEIFNYSNGKLDTIIARYKAIIAERGTLSGVKAETPFDASVAIYGVATKESIEDASKIAKEAKAEAKTAAKVEAARLKKESKEAKKTEKAALKAENARIKAEAKSSKEAAKAEAIIAEENELKAAEETSEVESAEGSEIDEIEPDTLDQGIATIPSVIEEGDNNAAAVITKKTSRIPVAPIVTVLGGGVAFKVWKDKAAEAEDERLRKFNLLMGEDDDDDEEDEDDEDEDDDDDMDFDMTSPTPTPDKKLQNTASPTPPVASPKKRRIGLSSVFSKKNANNRETVLAKLMEPGATSPEFATLLAQILSFGARGRFPAIENLPDAMQMEEFDLEKAKDILIESRTKLSLTDEISAEVFASVVNCMIIDIIDLASSSLGGKDTKKDATVNGLNIVMDFMDHAASLFDSVAAGIIINPVTYGGNLGKKKLEQMFTIYGSSTMTSLDGSVTQDRVDTLQQVFNINDKKAEGLIQKGMLKNLMSMMKDGGGEGMEGMEGMEGLSELMGGGGGLEGMPGFGEGDISEEDLKQSVDMMKELVESGNVSKDELDLVRQQFKDLYGSDINELITAADEEGAGEELGDDGKELLDLFKTILKEDD